jgi:hypothetical protein
MKKLERNGNAGGVCCVSGYELDAQLSEQRESSAGVVWVARE